MAIKPWIRCITGGENSHVIRYLWDRSHPKRLSITKRGVRLWNNLEFSQ